MVRNAKANTSAVMAGTLTTEHENIKHTARVARQRGTLSSLKKQEVAALDALVGPGRPPCGPYRWLSWQGQWHWLAHSLADDTRPLSARSAPHG